MTGQSHDVASACKPRRLCEEHDRASEQLGLFADAMQVELNANAYKGGWTFHSRSTHFYELDYHLAKLKAAVRAGDKPTRILEFAADLANHAMFLADTEGAVSTEVLLKRANDEASFTKPCAGVYWRLLRNPRWMRKGWGGLRSPVTEENHDLPSERTHHTWYD